VRDRVAILLCVIAAATAAPAATGAEASPSARSAHTLSVNANAEMHYVRSSGATLIEEGKVTGQLGGHARADFTLGATFAGTFTFYTAQGEIEGRGTATPHAAGRYETFAGHDTITGGTGRYAHAHGSGSMYGSFDRQTYAVKIQTRGTLHY